MLVTGEFRIYRTLPTLSRSNNCGKTVENQCVFMARINCSVYSSL